MSARTTTSRTSDKSLVIVHGRDFKPPRDVLLQFIDSALSAGIERDYPELANSYSGLNRDLAYYGDLTNEYLIEKGGHYDERLDIGDRKNAYHLLKLIDRKKKFGVHRYDNLPGKSAIPEFAADIAAPVLGAIGLGNPLIARVAKDLAEYWNRKSDFGERIRERVRTALCTAMERGDEIMAISHGTGCIVTYDVLWELSHDAEYADKYADYKIDVWLTLGAPLGDSSVRKKLSGAREKVRERFPQNVLSWHNVSAEDDYTCHDNTLCDDYKKMLKEKLVSCVRDYLVYNLAIRYGKSNPHSSVGYYIHPRVSNILADWLKQDAQD